MQSAAMEFTVKRLVKFDSEGSLKAYADLNIGDLFLVKGLRVVDGKNGLFVSMPRQQGKDHRWYDNVVPLTKETRTEIERVVLEADQRESAA